MIKLKSITMLGSILGAASGALSSGIDGLILGGAIGLVAGVAIWSLVNMGAQWQHERRLNRYFNTVSQSVRHEEMD
jgi:hypothetical protein